MDVGGVVRVWYKSGVDGETKRDVHVAIAMPSGPYFTVCKATIDAANAEILVELGGMPCMACTRAMSLRPRAAEAAMPGEPTELGAARPVVVW